MIRSYVQHIGPLTKTFTTTTTNNNIFTIAIALQSPNVYVHCKDPLRHTKTY